MSTSIPKRRWRSSFPSAAVALLGVALATSPTVRSQESHLLQGSNEFGAWGGDSLGSPHVHGTIGHGPLGVLPFRYGRTLFVSRNTTIESTMDVLPLEILRQPVYSSCVNQLQDA